MTAHFVIWTLEAAESCSRDKTNGRDAHQQKLCYLTQQSCRCLWESGRKISLCWKWQHCKCGELWGYAIGTGWMARCADHQVCWAHTAALHQCCTQTGASPWQLRTILWDISKRHTKQKPDKNRSRSSSMSLNMTDTGCLHMLKFHVCHDGGNAGAALARYCWPMFSNPNFSKKSERSELDLTNTQWNAAEDIKNMLKPVITPTELLPEVENTPLSATIPVLANPERQHLLIGDNDSPLTGKKKKS